MVMAARVTNPRKFRAVIRFVCGDNDRVEFGSACDHNSVGDMYDKTVEYTYEVNGQMKTLWHHIAGRVE
jgi:hypothetical protein